MRLYVRTSVLCLALILCARALGAAQEWEKLSPADAGFSILMPGKPTARNQEVPTAIGTLINHVYLLALGPEVYMVTYTDFPNPVSDPATIKGMLDRGRENAIASVKGQLKEEKEIRLEGHPGREWFVSLPDGFLRARAYWVKKRLYQELVMMPAGKNAEAERAREATMSKFLDSFALTSATTR